MQNKTHNNLIDKPKIKNLRHKIFDLFIPKKEPVALYEGQDLFEAIAGFNISIVKKHLSLKKCIVWLFVILFIFNITSLHYFIKDILISGYITNQNQMILKYVLIAHMTIAVGISGTLLGLVGKWPQLLPYGNKTHKNASNNNSSSAKENDDFDLEEYIKNKA